MSTFYKSFVCSGWKYCWACTCSACLFYYRPDASELRSPLQGHQSFPCQCTEGVINYFIMLHLLCITHVNHEETLLLWCQITEAHSLANASCLSIRSAGCNWSHGYTRWAWGSLHSAANQQFFHNAHVQTTRNTLLLSSSQSWRETETLKT